MKKLIVPLTLAAIVTIGVLAYWTVMNPQTSVNETSPQEPVAVDTNTQEQTVFSSLKDLMTQTISQQCTFAYADEAMGKTEGVTYVANGKIRSSFTLTNPEGTQSSGHMINDGAFTYTWDDVSKTGVKFAMTEDIQNMGEEAVEDNPQMAQMNKKTDYRCKVWIADANTFVPPTDIQFTDVSNMMKDLGTMPAVTQPTEDESSDMGACSLCDSLPTEAQASCRTSMNCE